MSQQEPVIDLTNIESDEKKHDSQKKNRIKSEHNLNLEIEDLDEPLSNPIDDTNCFSLLSYWWVGSMLSKGFKRPLQERDIWNVPKADETRLNADRLEQIWAQESIKKNPSIGRAFMRAAGAEYVTSILFMVLYIGFALLGPAFLIKNLLLYLENIADRPTYEGWLYVIGLFFQSFFQTTSLHFQSNLCARVGQRLRTSMMTIVYRKALRVGVAESTIGEILNMQSNDAYRVYEFFRYLNHLWGAVIMTIAVFILVIFEVGIISSVVGLAFFVIIYLLQTQIGKEISKIRSRTIPITDTRIRLMSEILTAIRLVKLSCWEKSFSEKVSDVRAQEVKGLKQTAIIKSINQGISLFGPSIVSFLTFSVYIALGNNLTPAIAFTTISLYNLARFPLNMMPLSIKALAESQIAYRRLTNFLAQEELIDKRNVNLTPRHVSLRVEGSFKWSTRTGPATQLDNNHEPPKNDETDVFEEDMPLLADLQHAADFSLQNINIKIKAGELVAVVGSVGCGKSSLLSAALGQMTMTEGKITVNGSTAYVSQQAWLLSDTIRNNILFGSDYEKERYRKVIEVCQLLPDLEQFPARDQTEIGEKGISLSGGQKQRVALARAVYANKDILLLDDPLSAVDQHVGSALFNNLLKGYLKDKAILFVNNQIQYLAKCDRIIFMKNGVIEGVDTFENLLASNTDFSRMVSEHVSSDTKEHVNSFDEKNSIHEENKKSIENEENEDENSAEMRKKGKLIVEEDRQIGRLNFSVYGDYAKAGGGFLCFLVCLTFTITQASNIISDWWISYWIKSADPTLHSLAYFVGISGGILGVLIISTTLRSIFFAWFTLRAATNLHNGVFWKVTRAPMSFFDSSPTGRILNRFSKDQDQIDDLLPDSLLQALQYLLMVLGSLIIVSFLLPWFTLVLVPFFALFWFLGMYYQRSARELKRLDSITRSPIVEHLSATLQGLSTIRAYNMSESFERAEVDKININSKCFLAFEMASRWLGWRLDFISTIVVTLTGILVIVLGDTISPSIAGLALSSSLQLAGIFQWSVRVAVEAESQMTSVERLMHYTRNIDSETPQIIEEHRPPENWPSKGEIEYKDVEVRYKKAGKPALSNLNFAINAQEKVGIVGRTGAGKSTLGMTLFRLLEPTAGSIIIDGIDITTIGLDDLRSKLAIIPQDPVLFVGSIRSNLDPFTQYSDTDLWDTLDKVHLKKLVEQLPGKLEASVSENGENFSVGQRQLLCIGRALIRQPKILVLDEATASIDIETDELIQKTIRQSFANCTVLTIANRLHTIIDSDKIMVINNGKLVEFDTPKSLLQWDSLFAKLVDQSGSQSSRYLRNVALVVECQINKWELFQINKMQNSVPNLAPTSEIIKYQTLYRLINSIEKNDSAIYLGKVAEETGLVDNDRFDLEGQAKALRQLKTVDRQYTALQLAIKKAYNSFSFAFNLGSSGLYDFALQIRSADGQLVDCGRVGDVFSSELKKHCVPAPYGDLTTMTTKVDPEVRKAWTANYDKIVIQKKERSTDGWWGTNNSKPKTDKPQEDHYRKALNNLLGRVQQEFQDDTLYLEPYKLNLYGKGGFFKPHVDTPRYPNMVGTLVVKLEDDCEGGDLIIRHGNETFKAQGGATAFFCDREHEVTPVTKGCRITLTFNICRDSPSVTKSNQAITLTRTTPLVKDHNVASLIKAIKDSPFKKIGILTEFDYTQNGISLQSLKGNDRIILEELSKEPSFKIDLLPTVVSLHYDDNTGLDDYPEKYNIHGKVYRFLIEDLERMLRGEKAPISQVEDKAMFFRIESKNGLEIYKREQESAMHVGNSALQHTIDNIYFNGAIVVTDLTKPTKVDEKSNSGSGSDDSMDESNFESMDE